MSIIITGLNKARVLAALYNNARPAATEGRPAATQGDMTVGEAQAILEQSGDQTIEAIHGRMLRVRFDGDVLETKEYNHIYGGRAARNALRFLLKELESESGEPLDAGRIEAPPAVSTVIELSPHERLAREVFELYKREGTENPAPWISLQSRFQNFEDLIQSFRVAVRPIGDWGKRLRDLIVKEPLSGLEGDAKHILACLIYEKKTRAGIGFEMTDMALSAELISDEVSLMLPLLGVTPGDTQSMRELTPEAIIAKFLSGDIQIGPTPDHWKRIY